MRLTLDALAVLDAVDRNGSFAGGAEELHRVPSAITYSVRKLEQDLGVLLFDRRGRRAVLTTAGRELLESGRRLLLAAAEAEQRVKQVATGWESELRVAVDTIIPMTLIWPLVAAFYVDCARKSAAHTRLRILSEVLGGAWDALADDRADLVLGASGDPPSGASFRMRPMAEVPVVFAIAPTHPLAREAEPIATNAIAAHRMVVASDTSRRLPPRTIGLADGQDTLAVPDLPSKIAAQAAGLGCGFVPVHLAAPDIKAGRLVVRRVEEARSPIRVAAAWRNGRPGRALAWWIEAVAQSSLGQHLAMGMDASARSRASNPRRRCVTG